MGTAEAERDEDLMAQVAQGRSELLEPLVRRHAPGLLTFIARMTGDTHRAEELFQEVFLTVWVKRAQYQYPRPFRPWLYAIALNRCRADFRSRGGPGKKKATQALVPEEQVSEGHTPAEAAISAEMAQLVQAAVTRLPQQQRAVVVLRVWHGLAYAQIAEMIDCTEGTVRSHMHHALASLREGLGQLSPLER